MTDGNGFLSHVAFGRIVPGYCGIRLDRADPPIRVGTHQKEVDIMRLNLLTFCWQMTSGLTAGFSKTDLDLIAAQIRY